MSTMLERKEALLDAYGRQVTYLRLSLTPHCNLRCLYCLPAKGFCSPREQLGEEDILRLCRFLVSAGVRKIRLTGGEPLLYPRFMEVMQALGELRQEGLEEICLTTNGIGLAPLAERLKSWGLNRLNISLDSLKAERFRLLTRGGELTPVLEALEEVERLGFEKTKINTVLLGGLNEDEIPAFVEATRGRSWEQRFIELMPIGEARRLPTQTFLSCDAVLKACPDLQPLGTSGVAQLYHLPGARGRVGLIRPLSCRFCKDCNRLRVTADGKIKVCLHSKEEYSLLGKSEAEMEQLIRRALREKWEAHPMSVTSKERRDSQSQRLMAHIGG